MTLHYEFPCIQWWHTVARHFEGNENFVIANKGDYFVVNYVRMGKETHPEVNDARSAILREARGMIFCSKTGELLSRPFHKFFNLGEREDVMDVDLSRPHVILEKLDGSMIRPFRVSDTIRWGTKMGVTDVAMQAEEFVAKNQQYQKFAEIAIRENFTPLFEWCSRQQRIVIDYPEDKLVLIAVRCNFTGRYMPRDDLNVISEAMNIPLVNALNLTAFGASQEELVDIVRNMADAEGVVIQFDDGHMVKIKADEYVALHRAKSMLENERDVVGLILDEKTDDLMSLLPENDRNRLRKFQDDIWYDILRFQTIVNVSLRQCKGVSRKDFALASENMESLHRGAVFKHYDTAHCEVAYIIDVIKKHLGSKAAFAKLKPIFKTASWVENKIDE